jgi:hypothetical protein
VLHIEENRGALFLTYAGERRALLPVSDILFRFAGETVATSAIVPYEGGLYFQGDAGSYLRHVRIDPEQEIRDE